MWLTATRLDPIAEFLCSKAVSLHACGGSERPQTGQFGSGKGHRVQGHGPLPQALPDQPQTADVSMMLHQHRRSETMLKRAFWLAWLTTTFMDKFWRWRSSLTMMDPKEFKITVELSMCFTPQVTRRKESATPLRTQRP